MQRLVDVANQMQHPAKGDRAFAGIGSRASIEQQARVVIDPEHDIVHIALRANRRRIPAGNIRKRANAHITVALDGRHAPHPGAVDVMPIAAVVALALAPGQPPGNIGPKRRLAEQPSLELTRIRGIDKPWNLIQKIFPEARMLPQNRHQLLANPRRQKLHRHHRANPMPHRIPGQGGHWPSHKPGKHQKQQSSSHRQSLQ